ncbi:MAG: glycine cleavage system H protein [marine bacterium B5-7]|nr:MAG: glycine cleavage system H protein [marine bacterium B5-7]
MSTFRFTEDHEWIRIDEDGEGIVGITDYAQEQLGELVYIELPDVGAEVSQGDDCAVVESVKAAGDVKTPVSGTISSVNEDLADNPQATNEDPAGEGWLYRIRLADDSELDSLMDESAYQAYLNSLE